MSLEQDLCDFQSQYEWTGGVSGIQFGDYTCLGSGVDSEVYHKKGSERCIKMYRVSNLSEDTLREYHEIQSRISTLVGHSETAIRLFLGKKILKILQLPQSIILNQDGRLYTFPEMVSGKWLGENRFPCSIGNKIASRSVDRILKLKYNVAGYNSQDFECPKWGIPSKIVPEVNMIDTGSQIVVTDVGNNIEHFVKNNQHFL